MAIQVQGTTVIDDNRNITNITAINGGIAFGGSSIHQVRYANNGVIDLAQGNVYVVQPTTNITITTINSPPSKIAQGNGRFSSFLLYLRPNNYGITWSNKFYWANSTPPSFSGLFDYYVITATLVDLISGENVYFASFAPYRIA